MTTGSAGKMAQVPEIRIPKEVTKEVTKQVDVLKLFPPGLKLLPPPPS